MTIDKATIINMALTEPLGVGPVFSIDDDSDLAEMIEHVWPQVVDRTFGMHDWTWAQLTRRNNRRAEEPENGWRYGFDLPGGRIGNPLKYLSDPKQRMPIRDFALEGGVFYCDLPDTWSRCKFYVDPDIWPPEWRGGFIIALGAYLAVPVWQDKDMRDELLVEAFGTASREGTGGLFGRLMAQDKASAPIGSPLAAEEPLSNARFSTAEPDCWSGRY
jgi:hypothetical protein